MAAAKKQVPEKPLTIRLEGEHRARVEEIQRRLGIDNPPDAVRLALKFYLDHVSPPPLDAATLAAIDARVRRALKRLSPTAKRKAGQKKKAPARLAPGSPKPSKEFVARLEGLVRRPPGR